MRDVERRYGAYPQEKRNANRALKAYFEKKASRDIYEITGRPVAGQKETTYAGGDTEFASDCEIQNEQSLLFWVQGS